jgi:ribosomal-protein-alanine N-acetyltransferase
MNSVESKFELATERLTMRWLTLEDADLMLAVWNDPAFFQYVGDRGIRTVEQAEETLLSGAFSLYEDHGYGPFRLALKADNMAIGTCGLFRREGYEDPDIGWSVLPEFGRQGYAYEAASAVLEYAQSELGLKRILAFVSPENLPSIGLAEKIGLRFERLTRLVGEDKYVGLYSVTNG